MTVTAATCKEASNWAQQLGKSWANADHAASSEWLDTQPPALRNFMSALLSLVSYLLSAVYSLDIHPLKYIFHRARLFLTVPGLPGPLRL